MHTPILRSVAVLAIALPLTACVKSEIKPASEDAAPAPVAIETADSHDQTAPGEWRVLRVGGEPAHEVTVQPGETKAGEPAKYYEAGDARISAALPETFAPPTAPGAIDLKVYDTYRRAVIETEGGQNRAFWPLFQHISDRDIAMTAPVVMTGEMAGERDRPLDHGLPLLRYPHGPNGRGGKGHHRRGHHAHHRPRHRLPGTRPRRDPREDETAPPRLARRTA